MKKIAILGCGSWATAVARMMAKNVKDSDQFDSEVQMFVYDETYGGSCLTVSINKLHLNPVYLPGFKIPKNIVASNDLKKIVSTADILAVVYPARFVSWLITEIKDFLKPEAYFISFCKGIILEPQYNQITLISDFIREKTGRPCFCVIGATTAFEVAWQHLTEATIGCHDPKIAQEVKQLLQTDYFRLTVSSDEVGVELCGALKNVVAIAAGIADGLRLGDNTKSAILRLGFWELFELITELFPNRGAKMRTLEESCGIAELFVCKPPDSVYLSGQLMRFGSGMSHRSDRMPALGSDMDLMNIVLGRALANDRRGSVDSPPELSQVCGAYVNGAEYAKAINHILTTRGLTHRYPLFTAIHKICAHELHCNKLIPCLQRHPAHE